jgi:tetratricopeptide (TPR) repeat protein
MNDELPPLPTSRAPPARNLCECLLDDQSERWRRGDRVPVEDYLCRHPELRADHEALLDLIFHELLLRGQAGETPDFNEYARRFPELAGPLRVHFVIQQARGPDTAAGTDGPALTRLLPGRPTPPVPAVPGYEILGMLGRGGMGVVYKARQQGLNRLVALKMVLGGALAGPAQRARFDAEAKAVARLRHPNVVPVYENGEAEGHLFFSMELLEGGSLAEKIRGTTLPPREAAALVWTLAGALEAAHREGIVHRDLKPDNVLLSADGVAKVADFGLAKHLGGGERPTGSGLIVGTPGYMAPEQAGGLTGGPVAAVGPAADVYALGAVLYECLTGRPPFKAETALDTVLQVLSEEPVPPSRLQPRVPRDLETIALKCLRKEPRRRYAGARDLAEDLGRFLEAKPILARQVGPVERALKWARRQPTRAALVALSALVAAGLVGGGLWYAGHERRRAEEFRRERDEADTQRAAARKAEKVARQLLADSYGFTAQLAMRRGDWRAALKYLDEALAAGHRAPSGLRLEKVRAWCAVGEVPQAVAELQALAEGKDLTDRDKGMVLLWRGDIAMSRSSRHEAEALELIAQAVRQGLPGAEAAYARGLLAPTSPAAVTHLERALAIDPFHQRASAVLGFLLMSLGRLPEAHDRIVFAERIFPDDPTFALLHASLLALQDEMGAANALLEKALPRLSKPQQADARLWVESLNLLATLTKEAGAPGVSRLKLLPAALRLVLRLPEGMSRRPAPSTAAVLLPLPPTVLKGYGPALSAAPAMLLGRGDGRRALDEFPEALRVHPEGLLYQLYGQVLLRNGRREDAEQAFLTAFKTPSVVPVRRAALFQAILCEWTLARGRGAAGQELRERALANTRQLVALGGVRPFQASPLAVIAREMNDLDLARAILADWQRQSPRDLKALLQRAEVELRGGAYGRVLEMVDQILSLDAKNKQAPAYRARALEGIRRLAEKANAPAPRVLPPRR